MSSTTAAAPDRRKRGRSPGAAYGGGGGGGGNPDSYAESAAELEELQPLRPAKRTTTCTAQSAPSTIANYCMHPPHQVPAPSCCTPLTQNYRVEAREDGPEVASSSGAAYGGGGGGNPDSYAESAAELEELLQPLRHPKRTTTCTAQSAPSTIANDCMHPPHQVPAPSSCSPLTENYRFREDEPEVASSSKPPWLDADERAILELMSNLEQAIRKDELENEEDSACSSSNSPPTYSTATSSRIREGDEEDHHYRTSSESDCSGNPPAAGDGGAVASGDGEIHQLLLRAGGLDFPANFCDNWGTFTGPSSQDYVITSSLEPDMYDDEWGDNVCYNPLLDLNF